jgi:phosphatidylserine decarboxylase
MSRFIWPNAPSQSGFPVAKAGYPFIFGAAFITGTLALLGLSAATLLALAVTLFICFFFRDPDRVVPDRPTAVVSPADGKVVVVESIDGDERYPEKCHKISIFMSIFNVHVNRVPCSGTIKSIHYHPGKFFSANLDKASSSNEHNAIHLEAEKGHAICFVQIAGLVARRIICGVAENDTVRRGQRFGLICFGSRLDVYLPLNVRVNVRVGDRVQAGTSVLGEWDE